MIKKSYAKVNLILDVVGKREDSYHLLKMIMQSVDLYDEIRIEIKENIENIEENIKLTASKPYIPTDIRNIAYKAVKIYLEEIGKNDIVEVDIIKNIPVAAGMAGGSTNGATVLRMLNEYYNNEVSEKRLYELGLKLGADVPFCLEGGTCICEGVGEILTPIKDFKDKTILLVKPPFGVSTKDVFKEFNINKVKIHPNTDKVIEGINKDNLLKVGQNLGNLLENVTLKKHPILRKIKNQMQGFGSLGTIMTGSGPTVFALFSDDIKASKAYKYFKNKYKETYLTKTLGKSDVR